VQKGDSNEPKRLHIVKERKNICTWENLNKKYGVCETQITKKTEITKKVP
jgi:hypothetical protein